VVPIRFIKKIVERGNVTVPSDVREALGIEEGDIVEFDIITVVKRRPDGHEPEATPTEPNPTTLPTINQTTRGASQ
jgi:AbrB family looped-hinge helix DNA binding protein